MNLKVLLNSEAMLNQMYFYDAESTTLGLRRSIEKDRGLPKTLSSKDPSRYEIRSNVR